EEEGQEPGGHGSGHHGGDGEDLLGQGHGWDTSWGNLLRRARKASTMHPMAGSRKFSLPSSTRHRKVHPTPMRAGRWSRLASHWERNITTKRAVMTNSMPVVSNWIRYPSREPKVAPATQ